MPTFATTFDDGTTYVSSFSINVHTYARDAALRKQYVAKYGTNYTGQFGPPSWSTTSPGLGLAGGRTPADRIETLHLVSDLRTVDP
jgi:hypothetical protein